MPIDLSVYFTRRLMPGADTLSSFAAPPMVPVTITARMTSTWRSVIMCPKPQPSVGGGMPARRVFSSRKRSHGPIDLTQKLPAIDIDHKPLSANDGCVAQQSSFDLVKARRFGQDLPGLKSHFRLAPTI